MAGIYKDNCARMKSCFYILESLMGIEDSYSLTRQNEIMTMFLAVIKTLSERIQKSYYATETCVELLLRIAYRSLPIRHWLMKNKESWSWVEVFFTKKETPSSYYAAENDPKLWRNLAYKRADMIVRVNQLRNGVSDLLLDYNSDTAPEELVNKRIEIKWKQKFKVTCCF